MATQRDYVSTNKQANKAPIQEPTGRAGPSHLTQDPALVSARVLGYLPDSRLHGNTGQGKLLLSPTDLSFTPAVPAAT